MDTWWPYLVQHFIGRISYEGYDHLSDGGPRCFQELSNRFRFCCNIASFIVNISIVYFSWSRILKLKECDMSLVKDPNPSRLEKLCGYFSIVVYLMTCYYKFATKRFVFMNNPCHFVLLFEIILLLTKKTPLMGVFFVQFTKWIFCPWFALIFPVLNGLDFPFELETFYLEHYLGAFICPIALFCSGRYGFLKENLWNHIVMQWFGFAIHSLYMRIYIAPICIYSWANLNFSLCHSEVDIAYPYLDDYYLYFADHYLNVASILCYIGAIIMILLFRNLIQKPFQMLLQNKK